ncbi:MAG: methyltransferase domain-containing protein [Tissierellia bacterium]|nr:methyltransferase domain-containing protein [Tissierellia bacterium]
MRHTIKKQIFYTMFFTYLLVSIYHWGIKLDLLSNLIESKVFFLVQMIPTMVAFLFFYKRKRFLGKYIPGILLSWFRYIFGKKSSWRLFWIYTIILILGFGFSGGFQTKQSLSRIFSFLISATIFSGGNEEVLWRGTLLDSFLRKFPLLLSSLVIGFIWGLWHLPKYYFTIGHVGMLDFPIFLFSTMIMGVALSVLRLKGSIFQCMLIHGMVNTGLYIVEYENHKYFIPMEILLFLIALWSSRKISVKKPSSQPWDRVAGLYDFIFKKERPTYRKIRDRIIRYPSEYKVLELCSGTGLLTKFMVGHFNQLEASDYSPDMLYILKDKVGNLGCRISKIDGTNIHRPDNSYDLVIMANALHILPNPEKAMKEVARILKPNGVFIVPTMLGEGTLKEMVQRFFLKMVGIQIHHSWTYKEYQNYFLNHGWEIIRLEKIHGSFPIGYVECRKERK